MSSAELALVFAVGVAAGVINTVAGGGSLLTLPLLVETGMSATVANATNRVAVWMQSATGVGRFHQKRVMPFADTMRLIPASLVGVFGGALVASRIDDGHFRIALALVFAGMGIVLVRDLSGAVRPVTASQVMPSGPLAHLAMLVVGFYAGFVQAGVGVLILGVLHVAGRLELVRANAAKALLVLVWTTFALGVFAYNGLVDWQSGLVLGAGGAIGAWLGVALATRISPRALKAALVIGVWVAAARFAGLLG